MSSTFFYVQLVLRPSSFYIVALLYSTAMVALQIFKHSDCAQIITFSTNRLPHSSGNAELTYFDTISKIKYNMEQ